MKHKNERAYFYAPGLPIVPKAEPWDPRVAGFPAILASNPGHPVNPVRSPCPLGLSLKTLEELTEKSACFAQHNPRPKKVK